MLDIKFLRENPDVVKQNIKNKFQDSKLPLVDEVIELDKRNREIKGEVEALRAEKNKISKMIGTLMKEGKREEAEEVKKQVTANAETVDRLSAEEKEVEEKIKKIMMTIPNIIDPSVPIGKDDSENVEVQRYGEPVVPDFEIPYHAEIMEKFNGLDLDSARKVAGNGFYYLMGDIARLHSAVISYARDFMINRGFTYCVPPFMIRSNVVTGVMSFAEMDAMMYKIEGEDLYLIGTSEHSMIGKFIDQIIPEEELPKTLTSYSPCFRKEKGAHGLEERGVYRIHQFEKQEMIVVCKPEDSMMWYEKLWQNTVDLFRRLDIPVRTLECCSGDLADLKVKSVDVEAWSPRQKKYNFNFQKRFGQNFLIDSHILEKIVESAEITKEDCVLEIGPGIGTMTQYLAESAGQVIAVEIDKSLIPILEDTLSPYDNVTVINEDILKVDIQKLVEEQNAGKPIKVVANLPYYITTPIIMGLFESHVPLDSITIMVQKEVAERMQEGPGSKEYGALSLAVQYYAKPEIVANVPPNCFMPRPNVGSAVIRLTRHEKPPVEVEDEKLMFRIIRASFNQRRKTLANGLNNSPEIHLPKEVIQESIVSLGVPENIRGEALSLEQFAELSNEIGQRMKQ